MVAPAFFWIDWENLKKTQSRWCHLWQPSKAITSSQLSLPKFAFLCFHACYMPPSQSVKQNFKLLTAVTQSVKFQGHIFIVLYQSSVVLPCRRSATGPGNVEGMPLMSRLSTWSRHCRLWGQWNTALSWRKTMHVNSSCCWFRTT